MNLIIALYVMCGILSAITFYRNLFLHNRVRNLNRKIWEITDSVEEGRTKPEQAIKEIEYWRKHFLN